VEHAARETERDRQQSERQRAREMENEARARDDEEREARRRAREGGEDGLSHLAGLHRTSLHYHVQAYLSHYEISTEL
jgi:hypothetical protein